MNWRKTLVEIVACVSLASFVAVDTFQHYIFQRKKQEVESLLYHDLQQIEERTGFHFTSLPEIHLDLSAEERQLDANRPRQGSYYNKDLYLNLPRIFDSSLFSQPYLNREEKQRLLDTFAHEMGHYFTDLMENQKGRKLDGVDFSLGKRMVVEGIGDYFSIKSVGLQESCRDDDCFGIDPEESYFLYQAGLHLVKPIIEAYGEKGIQYLLDFPPEKMGVKALQRYQSQVLDALAGK